MPDYAERIAAELATFADVEVVHDLPSIHHYWTGRYLTPLLAEVGATDLHSLWRAEIMQRCRRRAPEPARLVSLGAGNGELELALAEALLHDGVENLELVLLELNGDMLERAAAQARRLGIEDRVHTEVADLNRWTAEGPVDIYLANHSLHHVVELEHLLDQVVVSLTAEGVLLVNDMIGRNGHQRWPEAAVAVHRIWRTLPERYHRNHYVGGIDERYPDLDCSSEGFEGIRAQEILALLLERLHPETFVAFANVVDPFVDRVYGPNFDPDDPQDAALIDAIASFDEAGIDAGAFTPTHLIASFRRDPVQCRFPRNRSPQRMVHEPLEPREPSGPLEPPVVDAPDGWSSYRALRERKAVRLALAVADARHRLTRRR